MKLTVTERLIIQQLLPEKGTFINLRLIREAREDLSFNEEENKLMNFRPHPNNQENIVWDETGYTKEITFGDVVSNIVKEELKKMDTDETLEDVHFSLYKHFVLGE